jgi:hypothetical protein
VAQDIQVITEQVEVAVLVVRVEMVAIMPILIMAVLAVRVFRPIFLER